MSEPTLQAVFGTNATQSATELAIAKADLSGLTASTTNTAESLIVAQILKWEAVLTPTAQETNPNQSITVERGTEAIVSDFNTNTKYLEIPFTITLRKPHTAVGIDPDDY